MKHVIPKDRKILNDMDYKHSAVDMAEERISIAYGYDFFFNQTTPSKLVNTDWYIFVQAKSSFMLHNQICP